MEPGSASSGDMVIPFPAGWWKREEEPRLEPNMNLEPDNPITEGQKHSIQKEAVQASKPKLERKNPRSFRKYRWSNGLDLSFLETTRESEPVSLKPSFENKSTFIVEQKNEERANGIQEGEHVRQEKSEVDVGDGKGGSVTTGNELEAITKDWTKYYWGLRNDNAYVYPWMKPEFPVTEKMNELQIDKGTDKVQEKSIGSEDVVDAYAPVACDLDEMDSAEYWRSYRLYWERQPFFDI
ncbi:hypothetical protein Ocin01_04360 [Orchesella cincta]|uniref:Uncharacterized protein n=1 Tax=Orchesella cincta TaxID=48709 RepID=A0A1D2NAP7_ORCCI|nr:hypothetical protein Ocin01_04360 [Orchesella cincta]